MDKIVITGRGLITPIGNGLAANNDALLNGKSGIRYIEEWAEVGLESLIGGIADENPECPLLTRKTVRFTTPNSRMAIAAAYEALSEAKLEIDELKNKRIALILGCAGSAYSDIYTGAIAFMESRRVRKVSPFTVPKVMPSSAVANLSLILGITGETYDISSACASSAHAIMIASRLLEANMYDIVITGGTEELSWVHALGFNAMRALSTSYNDTPEKASRPFDKDRDGFVIAEGAGIVIMERESHAIRRDAKPIVAVSGKAANSNATDMVVPDSVCGAAVMREAIQSAGLSLSDISYINTHGTSTPTGDPAELAAIKELFGENASKVPFNSTKSMTGHMIGATGAVEAIYCSLMMENNYICPSLNMETIEPGNEWANIANTTRHNVDLRHVLTNSFGFGGTNSSLVLSKL